MNIEELISKLSNDIDKLIDTDCDNGIYLRESCIKQAIKSFMESEQVTFTSTSKSHYQQIPGLQAWDFARSMPYDTGIAFCYLWRAGKKGDKKQDLQKALDHLEHYQSKAVEVPRDLEHLFRKNFSEKIAVALFILFKNGSIDYAKRLIQDEINETPI